MEKTFTKETSEIKTPTLENFRKIKPEDTTSIKETREFWDNKFSKENRSDNNSEIPNSSDTGTTDKLTNSEKAQIKEETGWSDIIIDAIENMAQYKIYKESNLHEAEINGRKCLIKDIDLNYVDPKTGKSNKELMENNRAPIDPKTGEKIELHHMGQKSDGPFAELTENSEHGDGNHKTLHLSSEGSWRNDSEKKSQYQKEKAQHWETRSKGEV